MSELRVKCLEMDVRRRDDAESEANVPLVGCFANDTENRFTAGTDKSSGEKRHHGDYTHPRARPRLWNLPTVCSALHLVRSGPVPDPRVLTTTFRSCPLLSPLYWGHLYHSVVPHSNPDFTTMCPA